MIKIILVTIIIVILLYEFFFKIQENKNDDILSIIKCRLNTIIKYNNISVDYKIYESNSASYVDGFNRIYLNTRCRNINKITEIAIHELSHILSNSNDDVHDDEFKMIYLNLIDTAVKLEFLPIDYIPHHSNNFNKDFINQNMDIPYQYTNQHNSLNKNNIINQQNSLNNDYIINQQNSLNNDYIINQNKLSNSYKNNKKSSKKNTFKDDEIEFLKSRLYKRLLKSS